MEEKTLYEPDSLELSMEYLSLESNSKQKKKVSKRRMIHEIEEKLDDVNRSFVKLRNKITRAYLEYENFRSNHIRQIKLNSQYNFCVIKDKRCLMNANFIKLEKE